MKKLFFVLIGVVEAVFLVFMFLISNVSIGSFSQDKEDLETNPVYFIAMKLFAGLILSAILTLIVFVIFLILVRTMKQARWPNSIKLLLSQIVVFYLIWIISVAMNVTHLLLGEG